MCISKGGVGCTIWQTAAWDQGVRLTLKGQFRASCNLLACWLDPPPLEACPLDLDPYAIRPASCAVHAVSRRVRQLAAARVTSPTSSAAEVNLSMQQTI